jgi:hypothetical protein
MAIKVTRVYGTRFPKSKNIAAEKALLANLGCLHWQSKQRLKVYAETLEIGGAPLKSAAKHACHSFPVKLSSAIVQNKRLPFDRRASLVDLEMIAHDLHLEGHCDEQVPVHALPKEGDDFRAIADYQHAHRTAGTTARRMMSMSVKLRPWQHDRQGTSTAIEVLRDAIWSGKTAGVHIDIDNFYGSFLRRPVREVLPLPGRMVDHYIVAREHEFVPWGSSPPSFDVLLSKARSGIPHGGSASPIIGADTVSRIKWQPAPEIIPSGYVDNLMLMANSPDAVAADAKAVLAALEALPTGTFKGSIKWIGDATEGFDFLGVHMRLGKKLEIHPIEGRLEKFKAEMNRKCEKAAKRVAVAALSQKPQDRPAALEAVSEVWRYVQGWLAAFRMCDDIELYRVMASAPVIDLLAEIDCELKHLNPYLSESKNGGGYPK